MPISVECRDCGAEYRVGDDKAGKKLKCKSCGTFIPIFAPDTDEFSDNYDDYESPSATGRK